MVSADIGCLMDDQDLVKTLNEYRNFTLLKFVILSFNWAGVERKLRGSITINENVDKSNNTIC